MIANHQGGRFFRQADSLAHVIHPLQKFAVLDQRQQKCDQQNETTSNLKQSTYALAKLNQIRIGCLTQCERIVFDHPSTQGLWRKDRLVKPDVQNRRPQVAVLGDCTQKQVEIWADCTSKMQNRAKAQTPADAKAGL
ncbi:MAG: hypothetical protein FJY29_13045 [Betaproteobacteria bacterium]|nr:hypothetical protein [Betaproteobacteria bacterium]